jgi:hypothetical protein
MFFFIFLYYMFFMFFLFSYVLLLCSCNIYVMFYSVFCDIYLVLM